MNFSALNEFRRTGLVEKSRDYGWVIQMACWPHNLQSFEQPVLRKMSQFLRLLHNACEMTTTQNFASSPVQQFTSTNLSTLTDTVQHSVLEHEWHLSLRITLHRDFVNIATVKQSDACGYGPQLKRTSALSSIISSKALPGGCCRSGCDLILKVFATKL